MKIGIIGSGSIGGTCAQLFMAAGHDVVIANSRGPESLEATVTDLGARARAGQVEEAAQAQDLVLVAVPFGVVDALPAEAFAGRVVVDAGNYYPERDGQFVALDDGTTTSSQVLARRLTGARVVKAFNTMYWKTLKSGGDRSQGLEDRLVLFVAGDDEEAKRSVADLINECGFAAANAGTLAVGGRRQQPGSPWYATDVRGREVVDLLMR